MIIEAFYCNINNRKWERNQMEQPIVTIIILNWNGRIDTIACVESLRKIDYDHHNIIVVDNGSTDGLTDYLEINYPEIIIIKNNKNLGFTGGNNVAVRKAIENKSDYILLLNNDTIVEANFLTELIKVANKDDGIGIVQSKLLYYNDKTINSTGLLCDYFGFTWLRGRFEKDNGQYDKFTESKFFYASGACVLINKNLCSDLYSIYNGIFDDVLFAYYEDTDLSWNARLFGYKIVFCPDSICNHKEGQSTIGQNKKRVFWGFRNQIRVLLKNYSIINIILILPVTLLVELFLIFVLVIYKRDPGYIIVYMKSIVWNLLNIKSLIKYRKKIQSLRVNNDNIIMKYMENYPLALKNIALDGYYRIFK